MPAADIVLTEDADAAAPIAHRSSRRPAGSGWPRQLIAAVLAARPVAGTSLALLLRSSASLPVPAALVAESATYSALQEGAEFRRLAVRPSGAATRARTAAGR